MATNSSTRRRKRSSVSSTRRITLQRRSRGGNQRIGLPLGQGSRIRMSSRPCSQRSRLSSKTSVRQRASLRRFISQTSFPVENWQLTLMQMMLNCETQSSPYLSEKQARSYLLNPRLEVKTLSERKTGNTMQLLELKDECGKNHQ